MTDVEEIVIATRKTGNTTWILEAAIDNPRIIIVCNGMSQIMNLKRRYNELLRNRSWIKRLYWRIVGREHPRIVTKQNLWSIRGTGLPVVFDNGTFSR